MSDRLEAAKDRLKEANLKTDSSQKVMALSQAIMLVIQEIETYGLISVTAKAAIESENPQQTEVEERCFRCGDLGYNFKCVYFEDAACIATQPPYGAAIQTRDVAPQPEAPPAEQWGVAQLRAWRRVTSLLNSLTQSQSCEQLAEQVLSEVLMKALHEPFMSDVRGYILAELDHIIRARFMSQFHEVLLPQRGEGTKGDSNG